MPLTPSKRVVFVDHSSYCSAPPLTSSRVILPPRLTHAEEARRPRAPFRAVKAKVRESETDSMEFVFEVIEEKVDVKPIIEPDPRHLSARVAAISIRQPESAASTSSGEDRHSSFRTQPPCRVPPSQLGPARRRRKRKTSSPRSS